MRRLIRLLLSMTAAMLVAGLLGCGSEPDATDVGAIPSHLASLDAASFAAALERDGVQLIDVRTPEEFDDGHLAGAELIDMSDPAFADRVSRLPKDGEYALYCRSGNRSDTAMRQMDELGFAKVYDLEGGIVAWDQAGLPTVE